MTFTITSQDPKSVRLELDGMKVHLLAEDYKGRAGRKPRVYASGDAVRPAWEQPAWSIKGGDAELDKAWRKYNAEEIRLQKQVAERALQALLLQVPGFTMYGSADLRFSRKAGCSCGCSPALLLDAHVYGKDGLFKWSQAIGDIFIEM